MLNWKIGFYSERRNCCRSSLFDDNKIITKYLNCHVYVK